MLLCLGLIAAASAAYLTVTTATTDVTRVAPEPERPVQAATRIETAATRILGRCVDAHTGVAIAGCSVLVDCWQHRSVTAYFEPTFKPWRMQTLLASDDDGRFALVVPAPAQFECTLSVHTDHHARSTLRANGQPGTPLDLGDLALQPGATLTGTVVDTRGQPRAGVELRLRHADCGTIPHVEGLLWPNLEHVLASEGDGRFVTNGGLLPGTWSVLDSARAVVRSPLAVDIPDRMDRLPTDIVVFAEDELESIAGTVVDEHGTPIQDAGVAGWEFDRRETTDDRGRFRFFRHPSCREARDGTRLAYSAMGFETEESDDRHHRWGSRDVTLRLRRRIESFWIDVAMLDATSSQPIAGYVCAVEASPVPFDPGASRPVAIAACALMQPGSDVVRLTLPRRGRYDLIAFPADSTRWQPTPLRAIEAWPGLPLQTLRLVASVVTEISVSHADGSPVAGTLVEVVLSLCGGPVTVDTPAARSNEPQQSLGPLVLDAQRTDALGVVRLRGVQAPPVTLRVLGPGHIPKVVADVRLTTGPQVVHVERGATLVGYLPPRLASALATHRQTERDVGLAAALNLTCDAGLALREATTEWRHARWLPEPFLRFPIDADGSCRMTGIEPGKWELFLTWWPSAESGKFHKLCAFELQAAETRTINLRVPWLEPGELVGRIRIGGEPYARRTVTFVGRNAPREMWLVHSPVVRTDADGRFHARMLPGTWQLEIRARGVAETPWLTLSREFTVDAGAKTEADVQIEARRAVVQLVDAQGRPCPRFEVDVRYQHASLSLTADYDGRITIDPLPADEFELSSIERIDAGGARYHRMGKVTVPEGSAHAELRFRVR